MFPVSSLSVAEEVLSGINGANVEVVLDFVCTCMTSLVFKINSGNMTVDKSFNSSIIRHYSLWIRRSIHQL